MNCQNEDELPEEGRGMLRPLPPPGDHKSARNRGGQKRYAEVACNLTALSLQLGGFGEG